MQWRQCADGQQKLLVKVGQEEEPRFLFLTLEQLRRGRARRAQRQLASHRCAACNHLYETSRSRCPNCDTSAEEKIFE